MYRAICVFGLSILTAQEVSKPASDCAIVFFGLLRSYRKTYSNMMKMMIEPNKHLCNFEIFISTSINYKSTFKHHDSHHVKENNNMKLVGRSLRQCVKLRS
jgi:hypothetical protein